MGVGLGLGVGRVILGGVKVLCAVSACALCLTALSRSPSLSGGDVVGRGNGGSCAAAPSAKARAVRRATTASEARP